MREKTETKLGSILWTDQQFVLRAFPDFLNGSTIHKVPFNLGTSPSGFSIRIKQDSTIFVVQDAAEMKYNHDQLHNAQFTRKTERRIEVKYDGDKLDYIHYRKIKTKKGVDFEVELPVLPSTEKMKILIFIKPGNHQKLFISLLQGLIYSIVIHYIEILL